MRVVRTQVTAARAILFKAPGNLEAPLRLDCFARADCARDHRFENFAVFDGRNVTERTASGVIEQESATLRADAYHWSVLRCGGSSGTTESYHDEIARRSVWFADCVTYKARCAASG